MQYRISCSSAKISREALSLSFSFDFQFLAFCINRAQHVMEAPPPPVFLGFLSSPLSEEDEMDPFISRLGGAPVLTPLLSSLTFTQAWLPSLPTPAALLCHKCSEPLHLLLQSYDPLEGANVGTLRMLNIPQRSLTTSA